MKQNQRKSAFRTGKELVLFSVPLILSGILQQLYNWADAFIVGHSAGEEALAAVGATSTITNLFILVITGFTLGLSIYAAYKNGENEQEEVRRILSSFLLLGVIFLVLSIAGIGLADFILTAMNTSKDMFTPASYYLRVILLGIPILVVYNIYSALLRALNNSKAPFYSVLLSSVLNVVLDIIFVSILPFGVIGAAAATILSQIAMTVFIVFYSIKKYPVLRFTLKEKLIHWETVLNGAKMGCPPAIQSSINALGNIALQSFMNGFGTHTVAAVTTAYRIDSIILLPITNLSSGISTKVANSMGRNDQKEANNYLYTGFLMMIVFSVLLTVLMPICGSSLVAFFGVGPEATEIGRQFFINIAKFYLFFGMTSALRGYTEGIGKVFVSSMIGILALASRISLSYLLAPSLGNMSIAYSEGLQFILMFTLYMTYFFYIQKKLKGDRYCF
ncbi:MATE family efflux transporter [Roseburia hominis]